MALTKVSNNMLVQPSTIKAVIGGVEMFVPMDLDNRHYKEILRQTEAKTLVIQEETP